MALRWPKALFSRLLVGLGLPAGLEQGPHRLNERHRGGAEEPGAGGSHGATGGAPVGLAKALI